MTVQKRNAELVSLLSTDFLLRRDPARTIRSSIDVSDPPTDAELTAGLGDIADLPNDTFFINDDAGGGGRTYGILTDRTNSKWWRWRMFADGETMPGVGGTLVAFATPALTLGTANAAGSASTVIRSDATILTFDATMPETLGPGVAQAVGVATVAARRDHVHAISGTASHVLATETALGAYHTITGGVDGYVLRASGATAANFQQLIHGDLGSVGTDDHHPQVHVLATETALGADHTITGGVDGYVLKATAATTAQFMQLVHSELGTIGTDDHHAKSHIITSASDHTVTGAALDIVGLSTTDTLAILTPSSNPGAASAILKSDSSGKLQLEGLGLGVAPGSIALDIVAVNLAQLRIRSATADATLKNAYIQVGHYTNAEQDFLMMLGSAQLNYNKLTLGGGSTAANTATEISFFTATNTTTLTGSRSMYILGTTNRVAIGNNTAPAAKLHVTGEADETQLIVQGHATQTANLQEWQNSGGTALSVVDENGYIGVGTNAPGNWLSVNPTFSAAGTHYATRFQPTLTTAATTLAANYTNSIYSGTGTLTYLYGVVSNVNKTSTGPVTYASAGHFRVLNLNASGAIANGRGISIATPAYTGAITTLTGLYIEDQLVGGTNYAIYTNGGANRLGDQLTIDGSQDIAQLVVKADVSQTANLTEWYNVSARLSAYVDPLGNIGVDNDYPTITLTGGYTGDAINTINFDRSSGTYAYIRWASHGFPPGTDEPLIIAGNSGVMIDFYTDGAKQLRLTTSGDLEFDGPGSLTTTSGNATLAPAGDVILGPVGNNVLPDTGYDVTLGSLTTKYLAIHAAELWVETLVAQDTIATIGGRILVGPTTSLTRDLASGATTIYVKHNDMESGDYTYMEANGSVEFFAITSAPTLEGAGDYSYTVTRNLDGTGANDWAAGDAMFNTGKDGDGFIDLYSIGGVEAGIGPAIVGNVRPAGTSSYNDWGTHWAIGQLNGLYGYGVATYGVGFGEYGASANHMTIDSTYGIQFYSGTTSVVASLTSTTWTLGAIGTEHVVITPTSLQIMDSTNVYTELASGVLTLGLVSGGEYLTIDGTGGIQMYAATLKFVDLTAAGVLTLGVAAAEHVVIDTTGMAVMDASTTYAQFAATTTIGITTQEHVRVDATSVQLRDGTTIYTDLTAGVLTLGLSSAEHAVIDGSGVRLYDNATLYATFAATSTIGVTTGDHVSISSTGIQIKDGTTVRGEWLSTGSIKIGNDISTAAGTQFQVFASSGDLMIGDNTASKANIFWDKSVGELKFRGGTTTQAYIATNGTITAGSGEVRINSAGIEVDRSSAGVGTNAYKFKTGSVEYGGLYGFGVGQNNIDVSAFSIFGENSQLSLYANAPAANIATITILAYGAATANSAGISMYGTGITTPSLNISTAGVVRIGVSTTAISLALPTTITGATIVNGTTALNNDVTISGGWLKVGEGLYVGSTGTVPATGDVIATSDGRFGGGLYVGSLGVNPSTGAITATAFVYANTYLRSGSYLQVGTGAHIGSAGTIYDNDIVVDGGIMVGRTANPGTGYVQYTGGIQHYINSIVETGYIYVPIFGAPALWNPASAANKASGLKNSSDFSVPDGAKAMMLSIAITSGTAGQWVRWKGSSSGPTYAMPTKQVAGVTHQSQWLVQINASDQYYLENPSNLDLYVACVGYWI